MQLFIFGEKLGYVRSNCCRNFQTICGDSKIRQWFRQARTNIHKEERNNDW